jgi:hypothetical protein
MGMRDGLDEWATFVAAMCMTHLLEERLGMKFADDDVYRLRTLRDLASMIAEHSKIPEAGSQSIELMTWAVSDLARDSWWKPRGRGRSADSNEQLDLDAPLLEVLDPERWDHSGAPDV